MKICQVLPWFRSLKATTPEARQGGLKYQIALRLSQRGHQFKIISIKWRGQSAHEIIDNNIEVYRVSPIFVFSGIRYPIPNFIALSRQIEEVCQSWHPDLIVYGHMIYLTSLPILWLKNRLNIPTIVMTDVFPGISWFYGNKIVDFVGYLYSTFVGKRMLKIADGIQFMTPRLLADKKRMNIDDSKVFICSNGVDTELFKPEENHSHLRKTLGVNEDETVILYVGRLDLVKGVNYLLQAATKLLSVRNNIKFLIVGDGSLRQEYETWAEPISSNVIFMGWRSDIAQLMKMANIFVLPSLSEGAPNVVMEASASGLPVIATDVGEVSRVIVDGETGIIIKPKDIDGLVNAAEKLIDNPELTRRMGTAGRKRMMEMYSWEIICQQLEAAYQTVVERRKH